MAVKQKNPRTPGQRFQVVDTFDDITKHEPEKSLLEVYKKKSGRDSSGRISARHRGGGNKRFYRVIDFKRDKDGVKAEVVGIEYDPNRNARIALIKYSDGELRYIIAPLGIKIGAAVESGEDVEISVGNALSLRSIPVGTIIHNIEMKRGKGAALARSAGSYAQLVAKEGRYATLKLPSGEQRMVNIECRATIGQVGNIEAANVTIGKAGKMRHRGWRPHVRGVVMNPCDHPHGGGEGKAGIGRKRAVTPWGRPTMGYKTRKKKKLSNKFILMRRK
jgi:large subunit ribosomal protein L2